MRGPTLAATLALVLGACWSSGVRVIPDTRTPYDGLEAPELRRLSSARLAIDVGRLEDARATLQSLVAERPDSIVLGAWLQEVEVAIAASGTPTAQPDGAGAIAELARRYRSAAEEAPSVARWVLAARLEPDDEAAAELLDAAEALDPRCVWVHYGRAFLAAKRSSWEEVRRALAVAEECDPGHLPTRWLACWMLARGGKVRDAIVSLETWLDKARGDPRVEARLVTEAELDLAVLEVLDGDPARAQDLLAENRGAPDSRARSRMIAAAAAQERGDLQEALRAAQEAKELARGEILPAVQVALLQELWLNDAAAAEAAWTEVLALSRGASDLSSMLESLRARVRLERQRAERAKAEREKTDAARNSARTPR